MLPWTVQIPGQIQDFFKLDENNEPTQVAGCPPDGFSATGQLWGNPLYRWDVHKNTGFEWWIETVWHIA